MARRISVSVKGQNVTIKMIDCHHLIVWPSWGSHMGGESVIRFRSGDNQITIEVSTSEFVQLLNAMRSVPPSPTVSSDE